MNLVLGAIKKLQFPDLQPFLHSLFQSGFDGRVAFFVAQADQPTCKALDDLGVEILTIDEQSTFAQTPINSLRYFVYEQYLNGLGDDVDNVMLADVRDIIFQRDPFTIDNGGGLCCFLEDAGMNLATCVANSGWLACAYGKDTVTRIGQHEVSCSGTTLGTAPAMRRYLSAMCNGLRKINERVPNIMHVISGIDQGVHNYLIYSNALPNTRLYTNEMGPILTLNYVPPEEVRFNDEGQVINHAGTPYHVLHQYDRHPELPDRLLRRIAERQGTDTQHDASAGS